MSTGRLQAHEAHKERRLRMRSFAVPAPPVPDPAVVWSAPATVRRVKVAAVVAEVAAHFGVPVADIVARRRPSGSEIPRRVAIYLARRLTASSTAGLAERFGCPDEASVQRHARRCAEWLSLSNEFAAEVAALERSIRDA